MEHFLRDAHTRNKRKAQVDAKKKGGKKKGRGKTKEIVDPTRPKGPKGPYMCFVAVRRPEIKKQKPDLSFPDIARQLGAEWRSMSDPTRNKYDALEHLFDMHWMVAEHWVGCDLEDLFSGCLYSELDKSTEALLT